MAPDNTGPFYLTAKVVIAIRIPLGGIRIMRNKKVVFTVKKDYFFPAQKTKSRLHCQKRLLFCNT